MLDRRLALVVVVPVLAYVVGAVARPRPRGVAAELMAFDRSGLGLFVSATPTEPAQKTDIVLGGVVAVRGADLPTGALSRGARLPVKIHFGVQGEKGAVVVDGDHQVFLHIDTETSPGSEPAFRIHGDHWPVRGQYKTSLWQGGEFIVDAWEGTVPMDAPSGVYDVWAGLYQGDDRLSVTAGNRRFTDGKDRVKLGQILIE